MCIRDRDFLHKRGRPNDAEVPKQALSLKFPVWNCSIGPRGNWHQASEAIRLTASHRCWVDWASTADHGVNWSVTLASCSAPWQAGPNKSMRCEASARTGGTIFVVGHANSSRQADTIPSRLSWQSNDFRKWDQSLRKVVSRQAAAMSSKKLHWQAKVAV